MLPKRLACARLVCAALLLGAATAAGATTRTESYGGRTMLVTVPSHLPATGARALVVVLHGGLGNAGRVENQQSEAGLNMDAAAEHDGFIVAYLNGTQAMRLFGARMLAWNAGGGCCGQPAANNVDDVGYIAGAVDALAREYGVDRARVYGIGHSNGAMMTARILCETDIFSAGVVISGPLNVQTAACPAARGKRILAIHGAEDENVPLAGGKGRKGLSRVAFKSEEYAGEVFRASGAEYRLQIVAGADHYLAHIGAAIATAEGVTLAEKAARFFDLAH